MGAGAVLAFAPYGALDAAAVAPSTPPVVTTAAPVQTPAPPPPPTTLPYATTVEQDCKAYPGDEELANKLEEAKGNNGSTHVVIMARFCGVLFNDAAEIDPDLDRPWSNLETAMNDRDDPFYTSSFDDVTASAAQAALVVEASTAEWYRLNPELRPTTVPPTTAPPVTVPPTAAPEPTAVANTTNPEQVDGDNADADGGDDGDSGEASNDDAERTGSSAWQIIGVFILGIGAVVWGVSSVRRDHPEPAVDEN